MNRIATWASQTVNVLLLFGHPDQTVSSRAFVHGGWPMRVIDFLFFWEPDHCKQAFMRDVKFAQQITQKYAQLITDGRI